MNFLTNFAPSKRYPLIFNRIVSWANEKAEFISQNGAMLSEDSLALAVKMGVSNPEKIRIYSAFDCILVNDVKLNRLLLKFGVVTDRICGMTFSHSIALNHRCSRNLVILAHELRHVAQFEACGSLELYLNYYLMELGHFGYGKGPLEVDAQLAAKGMDIF